MSVTLWTFYENLAKDIREHGTVNTCDREEWERKRDEIRAEFLRSSGLNPPPPSEGLNWKEEGCLSGDGYEIVKLAYEILPGHWGTGCFFKPDPTPQAPLPAVLHLCGHVWHGTHDVQASGVQWARRGYACLIIDTLEQHDNDGDHHGVSRSEHPEWISLGYSGMTGEHWNSRRGLETLLSLPDVDPNRVGVAGGSGGGAHALYLAIADERVRAAASLYGISDPFHALSHRHLLRHCDCMYYHNPHQRDIADFAALIAPRPLLLGFGKRDVIFSRSEYKALFERTRAVYKLLGREEKCHLVEHSGGHGYSLKLQDATCRWFDEHVAGESHPFQPAGENTHPDEAITIFNGAPPNTNRLDLLPELLTTLGAIPLPRSPKEWSAIQSDALARLREDALAPVFANQPTVEVDCLHEAVWESFSTHKYRVEIAGVESFIESFIPGTPDGRVLIVVADGEELTQDLYLEFCQDAVVEDKPGPTVVCLETRGTGMSAPTKRLKPLLLRAGALTGMTPAMLAIQDLSLLVPIIRDFPEVRGKSVHLRGRGESAVACLYHGIMDPSVASLVLENPPSSHRDGGFIIGVLRLMDMDQAIGLFAPRPLTILRAPDKRFRWARRAYERLGHLDRLKVRKSRFDENVI